MAVCMDVLNEADARGLPLPLVASLSWHESRFRYVTSKAGAKGPLQVLPKFSTMVLKEIEELPARGLSLQRWKVLAQVVALGLKSCEDCAENRSILALNGLLLLVTPWPSDMDESFLDFSQILVGDFYEN